MQAKFQEDDTGYSVVLQTDSIALFVWLDVAAVPGRFSSNGFLMISPNRTLTFYPWAPTSIEELARALTVTSLRDVY